MGKISTRKEIKNSVLDTVRQSDSQIGTLVEDYINLTISEINDPAWSFGNDNFTHAWNFLKRKTTFTTTASTEDYIMPRDVDRISLLRQTESPITLRRLDDKKFYLAVPNPTATGNPLYYRIWENEGVSTKLSTADTIDVLSSSSSDAGSSDKTVTVHGLDSNSASISETYELNGTTPVSGTITFAAGPIFVSKGANTSGDITVRENSGSTTLVVIGRQERAPMFQVLSLYPIPDSSITIYLEYFTTIRLLMNDSDVPNIPEKWHWVVRMGALAKTYQYLNKQQDFISTQTLFAAGVRSMVSSDKTIPDLIEHLSPMSDIFPYYRLIKSDTVTT